MKSCCLQGSLHQGTPTGRIERVHGLDCYIAEPGKPALGGDEVSGGRTESPSPPPPPPIALLVILPDAFGWAMPNNRLLADQYAARTGARVYLPDFMAGCAFPPHALAVMERLMSPSAGWLDMFWNKSVPAVQTFAMAITRVWGLSDGGARPRILSFLTNLRAHEASSPSSSAAASSASVPGAGLKIGVAGFCWGGHHAIDLCSGLTAATSGVNEGKGDGLPLVDAGFAAHPSNVKVPIDFERVRQPLSVIIGDADFALPAEKCTQARDVLFSKQDPDRYEMQILPGARHGFALRWKPEDEGEMELAQRAEDQAVRFWVRWLGTNE